MAALSFLLVFTFGGGCAADRVGPRLEAKATDAPRAAGETREHTFEGTPVSSRWLDVLVLENEGYTAGFSPTTLTPVWVGYFLFGTEVEAPSRPNIRFATDPRTGVSNLNHDSYSHSGFDRGHMAPSSGIGRCFGSEAQVETFVVSNICPQHPGCNQRAWERLEHHEATQYAARFREVWVVDGPIFEGPCEELESDVRVPSHFFKILITKVDGQPEALAIVMPNARTERSPIRDYLTTVDDIELRTGLDFFPELPDELEAQVEADVMPHSQWGVDFELRPEFPGTERTIRKRPCD